VKNLSKLSVGAGEDLPLVSDRTALLMGRAYNEHGWAAEFMSPEELEFLGSYLRAFVLWQELGSKDGGP
jgi:hypothetical protein